MKSAELYELIVAADRERLCQALAPLSGAEREELNDFAWRLYHQIAGAWTKVATEKKKPEEFDEDVHTLLNALSGRQYESWLEPRRAAALAVLGLCDSKRILNPHSDGGGLWLYSDLRDVPLRMLQILVARRPPWLPQWIKADAKSEQRVTPWFVERALIRSGALPADESDGFIQRMAAECMYFEITAKYRADSVRKQFASWKDLLLADAELLRREIWRLFEVENNAFVYANCEPWSGALKELSDEGHLDRARLLKASVRAAALPFKQSALAAYGKFHEYLKPTIAERESLMDDYLSLLSSNVAVVVGFALKALEVLAKAERLPADAYFAACEPVFRLDKKAHPAKAIQLTRLLIKQDAGRKPAAVRVLARGLASDLPDVQEAVIELLESLSEHVGQETIEAISDAVERVAASNKPRLSGLLNRFVNASGRDATFDASNAERGGGAAAAELDVRVSELPEPIRRRTGVEHALQWIRGGEEPRVLPIDPRHVPRRSQAARVMPLESLDELIDAVGAICEGVEDAMQIERILDGIARFHHRPPSDFDKRVAALRKRVGKESKPGSFTFLDQLTDSELTQVIRRWLGLPPIVRELLDWRVPKKSLYRDRLQELYWYLGKDESPRGLLALPTHQGGWIDPVILAERLERDYVKPEEMPEQDDLAQAILRLTIDGREDALKILGKPSHYNGGRLLFYALGATVEVNWGPGFGSEALQSASVRVRAQLEDPAAFHPPRALAIAGFDTQVRIALSGPVASDPAFPPDLLAVVYGAEAANGGERIGGPRDWRIEWQNLCYPFDQRATLLMAGTCLSSSRSRLEPLFDLDTTWRAEAARAAVVAAAADSADNRSLATDALVEAIGAMLVDPAVLGRQLATVASRLKLNRIAAVLEQTAATSHLHHWAVFGALDAFLTCCEPIPADAHHLLSVMLESGSVVGKATSDDAATKLTALNATGKTAKLVKQLLDLPSGGDGTATIRAQACEAIIARAERWKNAVA